jgi:glyoxylase-like metal-dependent hydrolase (beta-lactamase superfamily II)
MMQRFNWLVVQEGQLPLRPDHRFASVEHRPTITLIWREGERPNRENSFLVDPYFTSKGYLAAQRILQAANIRLFELGAYFVTHPHYDHLLSLPIDIPVDRFTQLQTPPDDICAVPCPGHAAELQALTFTSAKDERVWVVSDAILDDEWLRAWGYYYPNRYSDDEIVETWCSIGRIFAEADVIVPGHGAPIQVNRALVETLIAGFPNAKVSSACPEVLEALNKRLASLS